MAEETRIERDTCTPVFIATLFTIARTWKLGHGKYPLPDEWIRKLWYIFTMEYYSAIKRECIWVSSNEVDEPRACYTEWSKSEREKQILYINAWASGVVLLVKNQPANAGDMRRRFHPRVEKIPWRMAWQPTPVFFSGESHWIEESGRLHSLGSQRVR